MNEKGEEPPVKTGDFAPENTEEKQGRGNTLHGCQMVMICANTGEFGQLSTICREKKKNRKAFPVFFNSYL